MVVSPFAVMSLFKYFKRVAAVGRGEFLPEETDRSTSMNVCDHKPHKIIITHKRNLLNTCKSHEFRIA